MVTQCSFKYFEQYIINQVKSLSSGDCACLINNFPLTGLGHYYSSPGANNSHNL